MANLISLFRVILAFVLLILLSIFMTKTYYIIAVVLTLIVVLLDALDGWVARKLNEQSKLGSVIDILGDRIVENAYWIVFCAYGWVGLYVPLIFMTRSLVTDTLRSLAFAEGYTAFGSESMIKNEIGLFLTSSRFSRAVYGTAKVFAFMAVIICEIPDANIPLWFFIFKDLSVNITVLFCVIRALPVIFESKRFFVKSNEQ